MSSDVPGGFDLLLNEIKETIGELRQQGTRALQNEDLATAGQLVEKAKQIDEFRQKIVALQEEWNSIASEVRLGGKRPVARRRSKSRKTKRHNRGELTPIQSYYEHIIRVLMDLGGKGSRKTVLDKVERSMKSVFNQKDRGRYPSDDTPVWEKRANFARLAMAKLALLSHSSQRGVWEITEKGKKWLAERK